MQRTRKKLLACSLAAAVMSITGTALAGQEPYVGTVGDDTLIPSFYISPKLDQFTEHDNCPSTHPGEFFRAYRAAAPTVSVPVNQPEICDTQGQTGVGNATFRGNYNARTTKGNQRTFEWQIALPKKPNSPINLVLECGIIKPNQFSAANGWFHSIKSCAGYLGEPAAGCASNCDDAGCVVATKLPKLTVSAIIPTTPNPIIVPLSAYQNPGTYSPGTVALNGGEHTRILMKACMDKTIVVALPVGGILEAGDLINVKLDVPAANHMDIYCNEDSLKLQGLGEPQC